ncbi:hypothetical protein [Aquirufa ecclesiirivi]|uniref:hypothetical protein n=1 Tax=Aquirufa ecclesiirivi TaxID=2715124 RepID=UPI001409872C|nr:hypothetical protein [Aquirufa ecclesiirivi]NHC48145.1 hypothetical protein [Aquirufa ecclesiirivi]
MQIEQNNRIENWLFFLEDPGAVTFSYLLLEKFSTIGINIILIADGLAKKILDAKKISYLPFQEYHLRFDFFKLNEIKVFLTGTSENKSSPAFSLMQTARDLKISTIGLVDGAGSHNERFKGQTDSPLFWAPDWLIVPDLTTQKLYVQLGFPVEKIKILVHPHYEWIKSIAKNWTINNRQQQRDSLMPKAGNRKVILFLSEISDGLNSSLYKRSEDYSLLGKSEHEGRTEIVLDEFLLGINQLSPRPYLVLRLHPKQFKSDLEEYISFFDLISQEENPLEIVNSSDVVVGITSSLLVEAYYLGKPVLSIIPNPNEKLYLGDLSDIIPSLYTRELISEGLNNSINEERINDINGQNPQFLNNQCLDFFKTLKQL